MPKNGVQQRQPKMPAALVVAPAWARHMPLACGLVASLRHAGESVGGHFGRGSTLCAMPPPDACSSRCSGLGM